MKEGDAIEHPMLSKSVERAQRKVEERNFQIRKNILEYDEVMEHQRQSSTACASASSRARRQGPHLRVHRGLRRRRGRYTANCTNGSTNISNVQIAARIRTGQRQGGGRQIDINRRR
jgi:hypothetical protein